MKNKTNTKNRLKNDVKEKKDEKFVANKKKTKEKKEEERTRNILSKVCVF